MAQISCLDCEFYHNDDCTVEDGAGERVFQGNGSTMDELIVDYFDKLFKLFEMSPNESCVDTFFARNCIFFSEREVLQ